LIKLRAEIISPLLFFLFMPGIDLNLISGKLFILKKFLYLKAIEQ
jgi:hypothetical protein